MRIDHIAYRVADRHKVANFFITCFGYRIAEDLPDGFDIQFEDGSWAKCLVLIPSEKTENAKWTFSTVMLDPTTYHMAPEIFISDGSQGSVVKEWVEKRDGIGGIHHIAYQVESVEEKMKEWIEKGYAEFTTEKPLQCPGLVQVFTKPSHLTGVIYEFIERGVHGFCKENVKDLMNSTKGL
jgi:hypothetical protein